MPKRTDIKSVMVIGSGPIVIGQAAEFDYSGTQACRVLREEGIRVILVNSNPATIMTDPEMADATYIEPIATPILEQIIAKERPDALLPTLGGQTALNAAMALGEAGVLKKYNVELIGASLDAIDRGEDRELFKKVVDEAGAESARSEVAHSMKEVDAVAAELGYPLVVRPSFTMGGLGSGIAHDEEELHRIAGAGLHYSPTDEVLLEEGIEGWKEFELELMRDRNDNVVVVCPIENVDPVGVHTGDSITVAPCFTLTDREYQKLRDIGIAIIRGVGVDTGGCNIQFAVHPDTGRIIVIEMNPRVSRSSALASKATGFPIAKIATKLALGYTLDEIRNDITQSTPASFEPTIDYVVTKVPRFAFEKFPGADPRLTTSMKSVGEAMALGGNFQESLGKAMRSIDKRHMGFSWDGDKPDEAEVAELLKAITVPTEHRYLQIQRALWGGATERQIFDATKIDPWFVKQLALINQTAMEVRDAEKLTAKLLKKAKLAGLSDLQIAHLRNLGDEGENTIRELRWTYGLRPVYKTVDTCAAEFDAVTPYYYSCYADETELRKRDREAVIILGSGPNRIGQGIEFDYTCVHAVQELGKDYDTIMVNCNPETVSTDYDMSNRLYFEPLTFEDVLEIYEAEKKMGPVKGVIVQLGGQTPLSLAARLKAAGVPILGTTPESIDLAENRELFGEVLRREHMNAPRYGTALSLEEAREAAHNIGYPVLVRPSYVLGGRGMEIVYDDAQLTKYVNRALDEAKADTVVSGRLPSPLLIDKFLQDAIEIDVDALFDGEELYIGGIMEHIEEAGVHSGDAACTLPPSTLSDDQIRRLREGTYAISKGCGVKGLINVQYAFMANTLYVIEANPRASRT
ncbi:carbamoyl-phosphate synthase large subunit, partial [Bifidobacterium bifidum]